MKNILKIGGYENMSNEKTKQNRQKDKLTTLGEWLKTSGLNRTDFKRIMPFLEVGVHYEITPTKRYYVYKEAIEKKMRMTSWREEFKKKKVS